MIRTSQVFILAYIIILIKKEITMYVHREKEEENNKLKILDNFLLKLHYIESEYK